MSPSGPALSHPAAPILHDYAHSGCPAETGSDWQIDLLDEAVRRGAHPSAQEATAAQALLPETMDKDDKGFAHIVP